MKKPTRYKKQDQEFDVHVWVQPEDAHTVALYTLSVGKRLICSSTPMQQAMERFRRYLTERAEEA